MLTTEERASREEFRVLTDSAVAPHAVAADRDGWLAPQVVSALGVAGLLGTRLRGEWGARRLDPLAYGLLTEELGRACQSARNLLGVTDMVAGVIERWGGVDTRARWLPRIVSGEVVGAFALSEPDAGSDAGAVRTTATADGGDIVLSGRKAWVSFGQRADVFVLFARWDGRHTAFLLPRDTAGLTVAPAGGLLGLRGSMLAELVLEECRLSGDHVLGTPGGGLSFVASPALDLGRYSTAWGAVGLAQACLDSSARYAGERVQDGTAIAGHQLVGRLLADMATDTAAARLLCYQAAVSHRIGHPDAVYHTLMAKYRSSTVATRIAADAVQLHGARGLCASSVVERHYRDAKVLEIIEGTTQIQQILLGRFASRSAGRDG